MKDDEIAGVYAQTGRFVARRVDEAVSDRAVRKNFVPGFQIDFQNAIDAVKIGGSRDDAPAPWPWAAFDCVLTGEERESTEQAETQKYQGDLLLHREPTQPLQR